ncbi:hypothetical protein GCM10009609_64780 [Pseudonocardia aurantiaca]
MRERGRIPPRENGVRPLPGLAFGAGLAHDAPAARHANNTALVAPRARAWRMACIDAPDHGIDAGQPLLIDVDATLVTAAFE